MGSTVDEKATHPHLPNFIKGFLVSIVLGAIALGLYFKYKAPAVVDPEVLIEKDDFSAAYTSLLGLLDKADQLMADGKRDEATKSYDRVCISARKASDLLSKKKGGDSSGYDFGFVEARALFRLTEIGYNRLEEKYLQPKDHSGTAKTVPNDRIESLLADIDRAILLNPEDKCYYRMRALINRLRGFWGSAEKDLNHAIRLDNKFAEAYVDLGLVYIQLRKFDAAKNAFEKAVLTSEDNKEVTATAYYNLGAFHQYLYDYYLKASMGNKDGVDWKRAQEHKQAATISYRDSLKHYPAGSAVAKDVRDRLARIK